MRKTTNKLLSALIAASLVFGMVTTASAASEGDTAPTAASVQETVETSAEDQQEPAAEETVTEEPAAEESEEQKEEAPAAAEEEKAEEQKEEAPAEEAPAEEIAPAEEAAPAEEVAPAEEEAVETVSEPEEETVAAMPAQTFSKTVKEKVKGKKKTVVKVEVSAPEGAFPEGTEMTVTKVGENDRVGGRKRGKTYRQAIEKVTKEEVTSILAVDITFTCDGQEIEPAKPIGVVFKSDSLTASEGKKLSIVHVADDGGAEIIKDVDIDEKKQEAVFDAESFSVYAVVESGSTADEARATVNFYNGSTLIETFYVKNSDTADELKTIVYDPGVGELDPKEIFKGWTLDQNYTKETKPKTIDDIRTYLAGLQIAEGQVVNVYAMIFKTITVSYLGDNNVSLGATTILLTENEQSTPYTVNMSYTPPSSYQNFEGWKVQSGSANISEYTAGKIYPNGTDITITGDVTFSVEAPRGRWLVFDEVEKGATYVAPQFIKQGENTVKPNDADMKLAGYTFGGWYTDKTYSTLFGFGTPLDENQTIYAKWNPNETANYTVIIWKQNVNDAKNAADADKKYDFAESVTLSGNVGDIISTVTATGTGNGRYASVNNVAKRYPGFHLNRYDTNITIDTRGNSIVNVYYDRNLVTLTFQYRGRNSWQTQATFTGLYGSTLASNGYTWPTNRWWYDSYSSWGGYSGSGTRTTFLDAFKLSNDADSKTYYGFEGNGSNQVHFLKEDPDHEGQFVEKNTVTTSNGTFYISDKYNGYKAVSYSTDNHNWTTLGEKDSNGYYAEVDTYTNLYIRFSPLKYNIVYMDGVYVDGNGNPVEGYTNRGKLNEVDNIIFESSVSSYNKGGENYYAPTFEGFVFGGWYIDDQCSQPYTFTTMPEGIKVYARWVQIQYRVFLHPNAVIKGEDGSTTKDSTLIWGLDEEGNEIAQDMNFRVSLGGKVSSPTGYRDEYEMVGWYLDEACTQVFNGDAYTLNETTVTTPYDKTDDMTDPMDKWGDISDPENAYNSDVNRDWITKKLDLYAKWRAILIGADGIGVIYDANGGQGAPTDPLKYKDSTKAVAQGASTAPEGKQFLYWVVQKWSDTDGEFIDTKINVYPGDSFEVLKANAHVIQNADSTPANPSYTYTVQLRAEYGDKEMPTPTYIDWYQNDKNPSALLHEDKDLQINEAVDIYTLTEGNSVPVRTGYKFLGWARENEYQMNDNNQPVGDKITYYDGLSGDDLFLKWNGTKYQAKNSSGNWVDVTQVAADERQPYHALYAVWEYVGVFYVFHSSDGTVDKIDIAAMEKATYDLTDAVKESYLYGGYFNKYFNVTDAECIAAAEAGTAATTEVYSGADLYKKVNGKTVRYWTSSNAQAADGSKLVPVPDTVYYLREIPVDFLGLKVQVVYDWSNNNTIDDLYLITTVDNNIYDSVGFYVTTDNGASLYKSFSVQMRGSTTVYKTSAADINNIGGYVGVWKSTSSLITDATEDSEFSVLPYWITVDGIRVDDDNHGTRTFNIGDKTYGHETGSMYEVK